MFKVSAGQFIEVMTNQAFDMQGQPEVQLTIQGNWEITQMQSDLVALTARLNTLVSAQEEEVRLRANNPALKDLHDQYQVVYTLVKKADDAVGTDSSA